MNNREEMSEGITPKLPLWSYQVQSNSKLAVRTRKDLEFYLIAKSFEDELFKQDLLSNPKAIVEQELGITLPEEIEINVLEETENILYIVLPGNPYNGIPESELKTSLGMSYEDVAQWVLNQQRNVFLDEASSITIISRAWNDEIFKQEIIINPNQIIEKELGLKVPDELEVKVFEEVSNTIYIVLPKLDDDLHYLAQYPVPAEVSILQDSNPQAAITTTITITTVTTVTPGITPLCTALCDLTWYCLTKGCFSGR